MNVENYLPSGFVDQLQKEPADDVMAKGFGTEAEGISEEFTNASLHYTEPFSRIQLSRKFDRLAATWRYYNNTMSSVSEMALLSSYQEIIGMGEVAIPLILDELVNRPNHWFWALRSITGENPIKPEDRGNIPKMTEAWLEWGRQNGYIS